VLGTQPYVAVATRDARFGIVREFQHDVLVERFLERQASRQQRYVS
jgi:hypothetical protein